MTLNMPVIPAQAGTHAIVPFSLTATILRRHRIYHLRMGPGLRRDDE